MCSVGMRKDSYCGCWICINNLVARHLGAFNMCTVGMRKDSYCGCWISINNLVAIHLGAFNMCTVGCGYEKGFIVVVEYPLII